ncbi:hypothetical protein BJ741DRAFT_594807 [Chytriomyces cf. hyalinus JEL632]|nr:hypothetical protein BJ741DRAFT_594807 [Chytriomyces cf. hyalinus JEL632]
MVAHQSSSARRELSSITASPLQRSPPNSSRMFPVPGPMSNSHASARSNSTATVPASSTPRRVSSTPNSTAAATFRSVSLSNISTRVSVTAPSSLHPTTADTALTSASDALETLDDAASMTHSNFQQSTFPQPGPSVHPQFRSKAVCKLFCSHCKELLCWRGMKVWVLSEHGFQLSMHLMRVNHGLRLFLCMLQLISQ